ncbi:MAG: hypothetical protein NTV11_13465 [Rhodocyclales bacterium]|nr:hypothetical protein [Rhodocyclales bacterium]
MKTTIEMPDDIFRRAKAVAALHGLSMKEWLTNVLRREVGAGTTAPSSDQDREQEADAFIQELNRLASDISAHWQEPQDAVAAIREQRRDLGA